MADTQTLPHARQIELAWGTLLLATCLAAYVIYAQAFGALWTFDDARVLEALHKVVDFKSAIAFAFHDDQVGVLRRPLAMASFLLNQGDWPLHPSGFRHINVLVHILNGLLLALVAMRIARVIPRLATHADGFAVTLAMIWILHPLLASTSLMVIQRMTLLSGTFSLLGCLAYLHGREYLRTRPLTAYLWMGGGLTLATLLGILAKENALLTPLLVGSLEFSVLSVYAPLRHRYLKLWRLVFFGLPCLAIAIYSGFYLSHITESYLIRPFTLSERVLSESVILFDYVRQILLPNISSMGPFQDDISFIHGLGILTLATSLAWIALLSIAVAYRKQLPALSFAVIFFLVGHLLESSIFPLELYFEHRNYLPSLGILGPLVALAWLSPQRWARVIPFVFAAIMASLLWSYTTLWANPMASAKAWAEAHPSSTRAMQNLATQYQIRGDVKTASQIIVDSYKHKPKDGGLALMSVASQCFMPDPIDESKIVDQVIQDAPSLYNLTNSALILHRILDYYLIGRCSSFQPGWIIGIANGLLRNPGFKDDDLQHYDLLIALARAYDLAGNSAQAMATRIEAFKIRPQLNDASDIFKALLKTGRVHDAHVFLKDASQRIPNHEEFFDAWQRELANKTAQHQ
jgi:tetratricopeptide (TPR) repeat protein